MRLQRNTVKRGLLVALLLLLAWPFAAWAAAKALIVRSEAGRADAIVVLAGSSTYIERAKHAADLFTNGRAPVIALTNDNIRSGWSPEQQRNLLFVERSAQELKSRSVAEDRIEIIPGAVTNTFDEAQHLRDYAKQRGWRSIVVVTSAYHSRRAAWTLRRVFDGTGVVASVDPAPPRAQSPSALTWWLTRFGWKSVAGEYVKMVYYWMKY